MLNKKHIVKLSTLWKYIYVVQNGVSGSYSININYNAPKWVYDLVNPDMAYYQYDSPYEIVAKVFKEHLSQDDYEFLYEVASDQADKEYEEYVNNLLTLYYQEPGDLTDYEKEVLIEGGYI